MFRARVNDDITTGRQLVILSIPRFFKSRVKRQVTCAHISRYSGTCIKEIFDAQDNDIIHTKQPSINRNIKRDKSPQKFRSLGIRVPASKQPP